MKKKYDSCVVKRDWKSYKTCNECGIKKTCTKRWPFWQRVIESVAVGFYRWRIKRQLKRVFGNAKMTKRDIRNMYPKLNSNEK